MILIDMDMPSCCANCPLFDDRWDYPTCYVTQESRGYNFKIHEKRMPKCPLREFSKKGRIIRSNSINKSFIEPYSIKERGQTDKKVLERIRKGKGLLPLKVNENI